MVGWNGWMGFVVGTRWQNTNGSWENKTSEKDEVPVLINGTELKLPITKTGKTELGKDLIFLFKGYNLPDLFVNYYSKNDQVNLKIKNTNFEENFDVSSIQAVFDGAMELCIK